MCGLTYCNGFATLSHASYSTIPIIHIIQNIAEGTITLSYYTTATAARQRLSLSLLSILSTAVAASLGSLGATAIHLKSLGITQFSSDAFA